MKKRKKVFSFLDVSVIVIICSFVMCFLGATLVYKHLGGVNFSLLNEDNNLKEFISAYNNLVDNYYDSLDKKDLIEGAIAGMYKVTGDPYTTYLDENSSSSLDESLNGKYKGVGIAIKENENGEMVLDSVYEDSPAEAAGFQPGDILYKVGETEVTRTNLNDLIETIKKSDSIELTVLRNGTQITAEVGSKEILKPALETMMYDRGEKKIGYIKLSVFSDTADIQFGNALSKLEGQGINSLVIDVRGNSGGYLQVAQNIAEMFIEKGKPIYSLESKDKTETTKDQTSEKRTYPVVVLMNKSSASASEILAAALKYSQGAKLVGTNSYGKGKVQERSTLSNGTELKYTTARWLTPIGTCIDGVGLTPDVEVELGEDYNYNDINTDTQLMKALESLAE